MGLSFHLQSLLGLPIRIQLLLGFSSRLKSLMILPIYLQSLLGLQLTPSRCVTFLLHLQLAEESM